MKKIGLLFLIIFILSCALKDRNVHFHDSHNLSSKILTSFAQKEGPVSLVLLTPYHSNCFVEQVKDLTHRGLVTHLYWVPQRDLSLSQKNAEWIRLKKLFNDDPVFKKNKASQVVQILDWKGLLESSIEGPLGVSLSMDLFVNETSGEKFQSEVLGFIKERNPEVVTIALSADYQIDAEKGWKMFSRAWEILSPGNTIFLEGGPGNGQPKNIKAEQRRVTANGGDSFAPGWDLWFWAPAYLFQLWQTNPPLPGDEGGKEILTLFNHTRAQVISLEKEFTTKRISRLMARGIEEIKAHGDPLPLTEPFYEAQTNKQGLAFRLIGENGDRGCMAFYQGVNDFKKAAPSAALWAAFFDPRYPSLTREEWNSLYAEVTIFGEFYPMESAMDFIPTLNSVIMEYGGERTLLQGSIAEYRNCSRVVFLEILCRKGGLPPGSWKKEDVRFYRAPSLFYRAPFTSLSLSQK